MSAYLLDLSNAAGERNELSDMELPSTVQMDSVRVLNVARSHLQSLITMPSSLLQDLVAHVTTLQVPFNDLDSLIGIEHFTALEVLNLSHNAFTVIDSNMAALLHRLPHLQVIDLSHNKLRLLDLDMPATKSVPVGGASAVLRPSALADERHTMHVTSLNLSHNMLIDLPDLRVMPGLQVLNLDYNQIEDISDIDTKLPLLAIHTLQIRENRLHMASYAMPLAALANTVRHVQVYGNPFTLPPDEEEVLMSAQPSRVNASRRVSIIPSARFNGSGGNPWWWRPYILWLLPLTQTLDATPFTASERMVAANLFRERGALSRNLIELLNTNRRDDLEAYLRKQGERATAPADILDTVLSMQEEDREDTTSELETPVRRASTSGGNAAPAMRNMPTVLTANSGRTRGSVGEPFEPLNNSEWLPPPQVRMASGSTTSNPRSSLVRSQARGVAGQPSPNDVLAAIQNKLRTLSAVVETLWQHDLSRRIFAAITIQKWYRGYATRRDLPEDVQESVQFIREQLALQSSGSPASVAASGGGAGGVASRSADGVAPRASAGRASGEVAKATAPVVPTGNQAADIQEVLNTMKGLQGVMTTMWEDLDEYRAMAEREQRRAATTIQRHYRGYKGRQQWRELKSGYDEFVESLAPFVLVLQRVGRGYRVREKLRVEADDKREVRRLRGEVNDLQEEMRELRAIMGLPAKARSPQYNAGQPAQLVHFAGADSGNGPVHPQARGVDRSQSATASVLDQTYPIEDDAGNVVRADDDENSGNESDAPRKPPVITVRRPKPRGSAPLKPGYLDSSPNGGAVDSSVDASSNLGSESELRARPSGGRIMKRRPSRGSSAEGTPKAGPRRPSAGSGDKTSPPPAGAAALNLEDGEDEHSLEY